MKLRRKPSQSRPACHRAICEYVMSKTELVGAHRTTQCKHERVVMVGVDTSPSVELYRSEAKRKICDELMSLLLSFPKGEGQNTACEGASCRNYCSWVDELRHESDDLWVLNPPKRKPSRRSDACDASFKPALSIVCPEDRIHVGNKRSF